MDLTKLNNTINENRKPSRPFNEVVRLRKSCRGFLANPVPAEIITSVLEDAQQAPSNCNTQPWSRHIVSGNLLKELSEAILDAHGSQYYTPDFSFDIGHFYGDYAERAKEQGKSWPGRYSADLSGFFCWYD